MIALQIGVLGPHVLTGCALGKGTCLHSGPGAVFGWSCGGTVQLLSNRSAVNIWVLGSVLPGACTSIVQPSSCLAVGRTEIVGSKMASLGLGSLSGGRRSG